MTCTYLTAADIDAIIDARGRAIGAAMARALEREKVSRWLDSLGEPGRVLRCSGCGVRVWLPREDYPSGTSCETMREVAERLHSRCGGTIQ